MTTEIRPKYEEQGIDTSAAPIGQKATAAVVLVDGFSLTDASQRHPHIMNALHTGADGLKKYRLHASPTY